MKTYYFAFFAKIGVVIPYFPLYYESLGLTPMQIGVLTSIMPLGRPLFAGAWTLPADRTGRRHAAMVLSTWLTAVVFVLYLFPTTFAGLALVTLLAAVAHAPVHPLGEATVLEAVKRHGLDYGRIRVWGSIGFVAASGAMGAAIAYYPVSSVLWAAILLSVLVAATALVLPRPEPRTPGPRTSLRGFLRSPGVLSFYAAATLMQASHGAYYTFYSIHMAAVGHSTTVIGALWMLGVVSEMVVMMRAPRLLALAPAPAILAGCCAIAAVRWGLYAASSSLWIAVPAQAMHAFTFGAFHLAAVNATHDLFPADLRASGQAVYSGLTFGLGSVIGSMLAGALFDVTGAYGLYAICAGIAVLGGVLMIAAGRALAARSGSHATSAPLP